VRHSGPVVATVAVLSDVHGALPVLDAVPGEPVLHDGRVSLRRTAVHVAAAAEAVVAGSARPDVRAGARDHRRAAASDLDALTAPVSRDGRDDR